jgi:hypothetical protein
MVIAGGSGPGFSKRSVVSGGFAEDLLRSPPGPKAVSCREMKPCQDVEDNRGHGRSGNATSLQQTVIR